MNSYQSNDCLPVTNFLPYQLYKIERETDIKNFANEHKVSLQDCIYERLSLRVGDFVIIKANSYKIHIVRPGESIEEIAKRYKKDVEDLKSLNKINKIFAGQQLLI